ncbi:MAG: PKD domain-containing protein [Baekduia sp.]
MRRSWLILPVVVICTVAAPQPSSAELTASKSSAQVGSTVTISGTVPSATNMYEPTVYTDWAGGACPADVGAAKKAARGDTTRGLGFAKVANGAHTDTIPITAKVVVQRPRQRVCAYGGSGVFAGSVLVEGFARFPPLEAGSERRSFGLAGSDQVRIGGVLHDDPLGWALQFRARGTRASSGTLTCNRKRFRLIAARISLTASGAFHYSGTLRPDNSRNYDAPIPLPYHGHATFTASGSAAIGGAPLPGPVDATPDPGLERAVARRLGQWGSPVLLVRGTFRAPGFHPFPGQPGCGPGFRAILNPSVLPTANIDQGTAGTDFGDRRDEEAGTPFQTADVAPLPEIQVGPAIYGSVSDGTNTLTFAGRDLADNGRTGWAAYAWDFGDGTTSTDPAPTHTYDAPGTYTVRLRVTSSTGLAGEATAVQVYIDP